MQQGIGMTSRRTRERLIQRLEETGIRNPEVLAVMRRLPRHLFVDEGPGQPCLRGIGPAHRPRADLSPSLIRWRA